MLDLKSWPAGMRVIVRKEIPHVGAQLRITDVDGNRYTAIATNQEKGQLAALEVRHRLRARCEDRIRNAKDTGLANLPFFIFSPVHYRGADLRFCVLDGVFDGPLSMA